MSENKVDGMFPLFRCARMLMAGGADTPSSWPCEKRVLFMFRRNKIGRRLHKHGIVVCGNFSCRCLQAQIAPESSSLEIRQFRKFTPRPSPGDSRNVVIWNAVVPPNTFARVRVKKRDFCTFSRRFRVLQKSCRLCENSDAKPSNPIFARFWAVLSDQKPASRENSLGLRPFSDGTGVFTHGVIGAASFPSEAYTGQVSGFVARTPEKSHGAICCIGRLASEDRRLCFECVRSCCHRS